MTFEEIVDQALAILQRRGRVAYRTLKRQFTPDDEALAARPHRCGPRGAHRGAGGRAGGAAGLPCPAGRGLGQGPGLWPAGGGESHGAVGPPLSRGLF
jgi:hypothetical protein